MTRRDWAQLSLQVLGIYAALCAIGPLQAVLPFLWPAIANLRVDFGSLVWVAAMLLLAGLYLVVAFVLFFKHARLVEHMAPTQEVTTGNLPAAREIHVIAFSVVGLFVALQAVPEVLRCADVVCVRLQLFESFGEEMGLRRLLLPGLSIVVHVGLGALLFLRAEALTEWWQRHQRKSTPAA